MSWASRHNLLARAVNRNLGGVPVIWGAVSSIAILEANAQLVANGNVISVDYMLHNVPTADFGSIAYDDVINVAGELFTVRESPMVEGDGAFCSLILSKVEPGTVPTPERPIAEVRIDTNTQGIIYVGQAIHGAAEDSPVWTITRSLFNAAGIRTAKGSVSAATWTGRASHTYS
jgi:hypothetical protein